MSRPRTSPRTRSQRFVRCLLCQRELTLNNFSTHLKLKHPEAEPPRTQHFAELDGEPPPARSAALPAVREVPAEPVPDLEPDDIVQAVVEQLAGGPASSIPVEVLPAVFAWRTATAQFLATFGQSRR